MNTKVYWLIAVSLLWLDFSFAQTIKSQLFDNISIEENLLKINYLVDNSIYLNIASSNIINSASVSQTGNRNEAFIEQIRGGDNKGNIVKVTQCFENNLTSINQSGVGNQNYITQSGLNNKTIADINGLNNNSVIIQEGTNNYISQKMESDSKNYYIAQQGANNLIIQEGNEAISKPYLISQKGTGMRLFITSGAIK